MSTVNWAIIVLTAGVCGGAIGFVQGFALAAHRNALSPVRPRIRNRLLDLFTRPSAELTSAQTLAVFAVVIGWGVLFLALCAVPFVVAEKLRLNEAAPVIIGVVILSWFIFAKVGKGVWARVSVHAV